MVYHGRMSYLAILGVVIVLLLAGYRSMLPSAPADPAPSGASITEPIDAARRTADMVADYPIEDEYGRGSAATTYDLSYRNMRTVSADTLLSMKDATVLDLSHNLLTGSLPAEIRHFSHVRTLDLSDNQFTGLPAEVGQLSELRVLDLSHNRLTGLPYELGNLQNLSVLDVRGNAYSEADLAVIKSRLSPATEVRTGE